MYFTLTTLLLIHLSSAPKPKFSISALLASFCYLFPMFKFIFSIFSPFLYWTMSLQITYSIMLYALYPQLFHPQHNNPCRNIKNSVLTLLLNCVIGSSYVRTLSLLTYFSFSPDFPPRPFSDNNFLRVSSTFHQRKPCETPSVSLCAFLWSAWGQRLLRCSSSSGKTKLFLTHRWLKS